MGDLYWKTGLIQPAEAAYLKAIALAKTPESLEDVTLAYEQLGQLYWILKQTAEAHKALAQAMKGYTVLGDLVKVQELQTQLERIKTTSSATPAQN